MTVISTDGASAVTKSVTSNVTELMEMAAALTGVDVAELLASTVSPTKEKKDRSRLRTYPPETSQEDG